MRTADFTSELTANGQISIPPEIAAQLPPGAQLQVVLSWALAADDAGWREAGRLQFEAAYAGDDSIYESLIHDNSPR